MPPHNNSMITDNKKKEPWFNPTVNLSNIIHIIILIFGLGMGWSAFNARQNQLEQKLNDFILQENSERMDFVRKDVMRMWQDDVINRLQSIDKKLDRLRN